MDTEGNMDRGCSNGVYFGWKNYMPMGNTVGGMANVGGGGDDVGGVAEMPTVEAPAY